jgi:hypothetical protein
MAATTKAPPTPHRLARRLSAALEGEVLFDRFSRGRYSTDASHYQIEPVGVVVPRTIDDARAAMAIAREEGVALLPRGGATSQSGQTVGRALVMDFSRHLNRLISVDPEGRTCVVEPGIVLDALNRQLKSAGLWFPVDVSTSSRATIGGMAGNNSCGTRSIRYGIMRDNVLAIDAILADGTEARFGEVGHNLPPLAPTRFPSPLRGGVRGGGSPSGVDPQILPAADGRHPQFARQRLEPLRARQMRPLRRQHRHVVFHPLEGALLRLHAPLETPRAVLDGIERERARQCGQHQDPVDRAMHRGSPPRHRPRAAENRDRRSPGPKPARPCGRRP